MLSSTFGIVKILSAGKRAAVRFRELVVSLLIVSIEVVITGLAPVIHGFLARIQKV
jgi:hypothetical protein